MQARKAILTLFTLTLTLTGCDSKKKEVSKKPGETSYTTGNPLTAPVDYIGTVGKAKVSAEKVIDTASMARHIQLFYAAEGRFPANLQELVTEKYIPSIPPTPQGTKYAYDAATGDLKIVKQ